MYRATYLCIIQEFIGRFETKPDGEIDFGEFLDYYEGVSITIPTDLFFIDMLRRQWNVKI
jgi:hypothetical protein